MFCFDTTKHVVITAEEYEADVRLCDCDSEDSSLDETDGICATCGADYRSSLQDEFARRGLEIYRFNRLEDGSYDVECDITCLDERHHYSDLKRTFCEEVCHFVTRAEPLTPPSRFPVFCHVLTEGEIATLSFLSVEKTSFPDIMEYSVPDDWGGLSVSTSDLTPRTIIEAALIHHWGKSHLHA